MAGASGFRSVGNPVEDFANVCYFWYLPEVARADLTRSASLLGFVQVWLPK
jgi:hypothetical protein